MKDIDHSEFLVCNNQNSSFDCQCLELGTLDFISKDNQTILYRTRHNKCLRSPMQLGISLEIRPVQVMHASLHIIHLSFIGDDRYLFVLLLHLVFLRGCMSLITLCPLNYPNDISLCSISLRSISLGNLRVQSVISST